MTEHKTRVDFCPHCGNKAPQRVVFRHRHQDDWYDSDGARVRDAGPDMEAIVCICETCDRVLLFVGIAESESGFWPELRYPEGVELPDSVPQAVRDVYAEASRIKVTAPNAFAVMLRRALETICDDRGVKEGSLAQRLRELSDRGDVPPLLAEVSDVVRILGNIGAHNSGMSVTVPYTWALDDFFRAIVEYVYLAPSKLKEYKEKLRKLQSTKAATKAP